MAKKIEYRQCTLRKTTSDGAVVCVSYIPATFAKVGKTVRLKNDADEWIDGWTVETIGDAMWSDDLPDSHRAIKQHRANSGDALPRQSKRG